MVNTAYSMVANSLQTSGGQILCYGITALAENISGYTIIINTVPAMILDEKLLGVMDKNSLVIDLASRPGGVDHETAAKLNRRVVWALGLPAKAAPMTAGEIIARTVTDILNERGTKNVT